jgi:transcriptional regulator with XRE-family HTH domain
MTTKIELSPEEWKSTQNEIESELNHSDIYQQAIAAIETLLNISPVTQSTQKGHEKAQILLKAITREAIGLSVQKFAYKIPTTTDESNNYTITENTDNNRDGSEKYQTNFPEISLQEWEHKLRKIGKTIQTARFKKGLSINQLHNLSLVLPNHIQMLETGHVQLLPKNYMIIKDMLVKLADPLDLDANYLLEYLKVNLRNSTNNSPETANNGNNKNLFSMFSFLYR